MSNPVLSRTTNTINPYPHQRQYVTPVTRSSILSKVGVLLLVVAATVGLYIKYMPQQSNVQLVVLGASFVAVLACSWFMLKTPKLSAPLAFLLSVAEGVFAGAITAVAVTYTDSWVMPLQAVGATLATFLAMYVLYATNVLRPTKKFRAVIFAATAAIAVFYGVAFLLSLAGIQAPLINSSSPIGIAFTIGVIIIAALGLIVDFGNIDDAVASQQLDKRLEWGLAGGLVVSLVWLYIEFLRLLLKLYSN